jgi:hypothetical protein
VIFGRRSFPSLPRLGGRGAAPPRPGTGFLRHSCLRPHSPWSSFRTIFVSGYGGESPARPRRAARTLGHAEPLQRSAHAGKPGAATTTDGPAASVKPAARGERLVAIGARPRRGSLVRFHSSESSAATQLSRTAAREPAAARRPPFAQRANPPASSATPPVASSAAPSNASVAKRLLPWRHLRRGVAPSSPPPRRPLLPARTAGPAVTVRRGVAAGAAPPVAALRGVPVTVVSDSTAVQAVVERYLDAFRTFSVEEAKAVWPSVNERALGRALQAWTSRKLNWTLHHQRHRTERRCVVQRRRAICRRSDKTMRIERRHGSSS